jgi:hypothetical protein
VYQRFQLSAIRSRVSALGANRGPKNDNSAAKAALLNADS